MLLKPMARIMCSALFSMLVTISTSANELILNSDFETGPQGWDNFVHGEKRVTSEWLGNGGRDESGGIHISSTKGGKRAVWFWRSAIKEIPTGKSLQVSAWAKGLGIKKFAAVFIVGGNSDMPTVQDLTSHEAPLKGDFDWQPITINFNPSPDITEVIVQLMLVGKGEVWFDDVTMTSVEDVTEDTKKAAEAPGLFMVRGSKKFTANRGVRKSTPGPKLLIPLPSSYHTQVPLTYELFTNPPDKVEGVSVFREKYSQNNYVAEVVLSELKPGEIVELHWSSIVLCGPQSFTDMPAEAPLPEEWPAHLKRWLVSTPCAQADHRQIKRVARKIRGDLTDVMDIIQSTIFKTMEIYGNQSRLRWRRLDALDALTRRGNCTSCANLMVALLRANNIPARIMAGYDTQLGPHQTHFTIEAFVPGFGWYPIESSTLVAPIQPYRHIKVSIVETVYEELSAKRPFVAGCNPYLSLTEHLDYQGTYSARGMVDEANNCDHVATLWRAFPRDIPADEWDRAINMAKSLWMEWLTSSPSLDGHHRLTMPLTNDMINATRPRDLVNIYEQQGLPDRP